MGKHSVRLVQDAPQQHDMEEALGIGGGWSATGAPVSREAMERLGRPRTPVDLVLGGLQTEFDGLVDEMRAQFDAVAMPFPDEAVGAFLHRLRGYLAKGDEGMARLTVASARERLGGELLAAAEGRSLIEATRRREEEARELAAEFGELIAAEGWWTVPPEQRADIERLFQQAAVVLDLNAMREAVRLLPELIADCVAEAGAARVAAAEAKLKREVDALVARGPRGVIAATERGGWSQLRLAENGEIRVTGEELPEPLARALAALQEPIRDALAVRQRERPAVAAPTSSRA